MSVGYCAVQWNRAKIIYDAILLAGIVLYISMFLLIAARVDPPKDLAATIDLLIRAFGSCAFVMLTIILAIGPLARLDRRFLPLLYNRRHFGVLTFIVALLHVAFMLQWYAVQGNLPNLVTELTTWADYGKFIGFPFKVLGIAALIVLFLMAATSHDFWLAFLGPPIWKALHMALRRLWPSSDACRARHHAVRAHRAHSADADRRVHHCNHSPPGSGPA